MVPVKLIIEFFAVLYMPFICFDLLPSYLVTFLDNLCVFYC